MRARSRIAQASPLFEPVPPALYGGTERVMAYLTDELVRRGHRGCRVVKSRLDLRIAQEERGSRVAGS